MSKKRISVVMEEELYKTFAKRVIDEKGKLAISEKVEELVREYVKKRTG